MVIPAEAASLQPPTDRSAASPPMSTTTTTMVVASPAREAAKAHLVKNLSFPILRTMWVDGRASFASLNAEGEAVGRREDTEAAARHPIPPPPPPRFSPREDPRLEKQAGEPRQSTLRPTASPKGRRKADWQTDADAEAAVAVSDLPWNLRTRRGSARARMATVWSSSVGWSSPEKQALGQSREDAEQRGRPRFSITLTKEEIEEDVYAVTGCRARRRPRKRPRAIQKMLNALLPGSRLTEIDDSLYKVRCID